jgi:hypothetical protein
VELGSLGWRGQAPRFGQLVRADAQMPCAQHCAVSCVSYPAVLGWRRTWQAACAVKELHTSLVPDKEVVVPVTVGLPVAGTRSCANQDKKSIKITRNVLVESVDECISR